MEGSSDSTWQKSDGSRGLSTSNVTDRNLRLLRVERINFSGDAQQDFAFRKVRDRVLSASADSLRNQAGLSHDFEEELTVNPFFRALEWEDVSLRQWLDKPDRQVDEFECLHIFRQIVEIVNVAHSQGVVIQNVRPSCFVMSSFNRVSFIESASCSDSGSDSLEDGSNSRTEAKDESSSFPHDMHQQRRSENSHSAGIPTIVLSGNSCIRSSSIYAAKVSLMEEIGDNKIKDGSIAEQAKENAPPFPMKQVLHMEASWYTSPEEVAGAPSCCASDIYRLGILLFEVCL